MRRMWKEVHFFLRVEGGALRRTSISLLVVVLLEHHYYNGKPFIIIPAFSQFQISMSLLALYIKKTFKVYQKKRKKLSNFDGTTSGSSLY